jgi:hypothetical protein
LPAFEIETFDEIYHPSDLEWGQLTQQRKTNIAMTLKI